MTLEMSQATATASPLTSSPSPILQLLTEDTVYVARAQDELKRRNAFADTFLEDLAEHLRVSVDIETNKAEWGLSHVNSFHVTLDRSHRTVIRVIQRERDTALDSKNPRIQLDLGSVPKAVLSPTARELYALGWNSPEKILANLSAIDAGKRKPAVVAEFLRATLRIISEAIRQTLQSIPVQDPPITIDIDIVCKAGLERSILLFNVLLFAFKTLREFEKEPGDILAAARRSTTPSPFIPDRPGRENHTDRVQVKRITWDSMMELLGPRLVSLLEQYRKS